MAILKFANSRGKYQDSNATKNVMDYIFNPDKSKCALYGFYQVDPMNPSKSMRDVAEAFGKTNGIQIRHYIISFTKYEMREPIIVDQIAQKISTYFQDQYQCVYAIHEDTEYLHIHLICNAVSYVDGHRYRGNKTEYYDFVSWLKRLLSKYSIYTLYVYKY